MVKRSPDQFVVEFLPFALKTQAATGISAIAILSQAALESGWAERAVGNMFFGIKDTDGKNGNEQLVATTEYLAKPDQHRLFPEVISVDWVPSVKKYKYRVRDWFRKYDSPEGSFIDHAQFFLRNPRYSKAVAVGRDHQLFFREIAAAGYATGPAYFETLLAVSRMIEKRMPKTGPAGGSQLESFEFEPDLELPDADEIRLLVPVRRAV